MKCVEPGAGELVKLAQGREDDEPDLHVAKHGELVGLLEQAAAPLREGHLPSRRVLDPLHLRLPPPHGRSEEEGGDSSRSRSATPFKGAQ
ncbi:hypothetical protein ZIOFF_062631 [Zingiber officinale]|uniref:Uncharacterized protein n=1 Tax=Zingiber officinale TaxID=94328 RepID=A0A8J5K9E1_ZINOF|nr:hypothetical protein ZIOFF_062631 [Zingiber officinale]